METPMAEMRAMEFTWPSEDLSLRLTTRPVPELREGEMLIQICAAGVTALKSFGTQPRTALMVYRERSYPGTRVLRYCCGTRTGISGYLVIWLDRLTAKPNPARN